jgi:hypothetical protein
MRDLPGEPGLRWHHTQMGLGWAVTVECASDAVQLHVPLSALERPVALNALAAVLAREFAAIGWPPRLGSAILQQLKEEVVT